MRVRTTCNRDCPDACGIVATVDAGRIVKIQGDPDHPVTRGFLCYRTSRFLERQYDPDRLTTPLIRRGDGLRPASWDDALDLIAETMLRIKAESGGEAILHYRSGGSLGMMKAIGDAFFQAFGPCSAKDGDICSGAGDDAQLTDFGDEDSNDLFDLLNAKTIVLWGKNPYISNLHILPVLEEAKANGARIVTIDPVRHRGADLAEMFLQPRPGGDIALALGIARRLFETGRTDPGAASYCDHFDDFRATAESKTIEAWAALADVRPQEIVQLADLYANGPSAILVGWGMQRRTNGSATVRLLDALAAVSGNIGVPGGGVSFYFKRRGAFDTSLGLGLGEPPRRIMEPTLGRSLLEASDPPVRMVWVTAGNPVAMLPDSKAVAHALETREMTVVVDSFLTDTARTARVVLPTTTMLEDDDLVGAYGHHFLGELRPVVPPPDGVRTDYEILVALAERVGLSETFSGSVESWKRRLLAPVADKGVSLEALRAGYVKNPIAPKILFADRRFKTASGRVNLIHDVDPEPARPTSDRPLLLMACSTEKAQSSQWAHPRKQAGPATATVHPAVANGFIDGETVRLESAMGSLEVTLKFDDRQRKDVVLMAKGGWLHTGRCANAIIPAATTDAGGGAVYYDTPVRLVAR
ncbi:MAG TPA: molybdopterin-dependent oxidoreductase [Candidatus Polarisedimenticolaceae bacterium]|nr:molybdopterin-dependent oxidoreductase [Candidatus Polarisedimenticolaceae bacterium]